jgi:hypothetical protein
MFAAMSALALGQVLGLAESGERRHAWIASTFVGLAALARTEGLVLFATMVVLCGFLARRGQRAAVVVASVAPFAILVGGYIAARGFATGDWALGLRERSYYAFEQGQGIGTRERYALGAERYVEGQLEARRLYGTAEQNGSSVATAIARNPEAYARRVVQTVAQVPRTVIMIYGGVLGALLAALALRGALRLARAGERRVLAVLLLWPTHLLLQVLVVYRAEHFLLPFAVILALAAVGASAVAGALPNVLERRLWTGLLTAVLILGVVLAKPALFAGGALVLVALPAAWTMRDRLPAEPRGIALVSLLAVGLAVRGGFPEPRMRGLGETPEEQAILYLRERLPSGSPVAAAAPGLAWTAGMIHVPLHREAREVARRGDLGRWLMREGVRAVVVGPTLRAREPSVAAAIDSLLGRELELGFRSGDGRVEVYLPRRDPAVNQP